MNIKSVLCELKRQKEKMMAWKEAKSLVRRKKKYTARKNRNENTNLQQDKQAKVNETTKLISNLRKESDSSKNGKTLIKEQKEHPG